MSTQSPHHRPGDQRTGPPATGTAPPERAVFQAGDVVAFRFRIVRYIAKGGMGELCEAEDLELHERVALKTVLSGIAEDERAVLLFKREVHLARQVTHPNVCRIYDVFRHRPGDAGVPSRHDVVFLTMELLHGENLVQSHGLVGDVQQARSIAEQARAKKLECPYLSLYLYQLAFFQNDATGMAAQVAWAAGKAGVEDVLWAAEASSSAYAGRLAKAREFSRQAIASARRGGSDETAASYEVNAALRAAFFGNAAEAQQHAAAALALASGRDVKVGAALALAVAGAVQRAQSVAADLATDFPDDTLVQLNFLPTINAQIALARQDPSKAIELLKLATPVELGRPGDAAFTPALYPVYLRAEAFRAARQGTEAAAEFQKVLDHRSVVVNEPIGALAHLGLARAHDLQGHAERARAAYSDFLELWKDADPDIPVFKQAKAEYARLR
jgi:tetratricopeptide (TPR) repeat protein